MYFRNPNSIGVGFSCRFFALFVLFERKYRLSSGLILYSRLRFDSFGSLLSKVFYMANRKFSLALIDTIFAFELWVFILELSITGQRCLYAPRVKGVDSP
jgi:hypothetical protein